MCSSKNSIDVVVRIFHWFLVTLFIALFITGDNNHNTLHIVLGYLLISLIISRLAWGFIGTRNALWKHYLHTPQSVFGYLSKLKQQRPTTFTIHNPAGSMMILAMLCMLILIVISGLLMQGLFELDGIFYPLTQSLADSHAFLIRNVHDMLSWLMIFTIVLHIMGVIYSSKIYRINLALMMINGKSCDSKNRRKS